MKDNKYCFLSTNDIGDVGEVITAKTLRDDFGLTVVRTIYLPYKDKSVEIDMIAISDKGIFVIENKNYTGMVYGHVDSDYWKVKYADTTIRMFNPISQNYAHCLAVEDLLHTYNKKLKFPIFNIVIFNDKAKLCLKQPRNVYKISDFKKYYLEEILFPQETMWVSTEI